MRIPTLQTVLLLLIEQAKGQAYEASLLNDVSHCYREDFRESTVYITLRRLFKEGLISAEKGEPQKKRGGRAVIYYRLTEKGKRTLQKYNQVLIRLYWKLNYP